MATQRQFGQELNQNVRRDPNLTMEQKYIIAGMLCGGCSIKECADAYGRTACCIRNLWKEYSCTGTTQDEPHSGRPPMLPFIRKRLSTRRFAQNL
jgi:hypothetical protein